MSEQVHKDKQETKAVEAEDLPVGQSEESKAKTAEVKAETEDLLNDIDELLGTDETQAETFVNSFVQKGGE